MRLLIALLSAVAALPALDQAEARHLLARTGFGANQAGITALLPLTRAEAVEAVLHTARCSPVLLPPEWCREPLPKAWQERQAERKEIEALPEAEREEREKRYNKIRARDARHGKELKAWWYGEMLATDSPLTERMVLFWHGHFTSQLTVVEDPRLMWEQNALLRRHALGSFADLAHAIPFDAAMFRYLDSDSNVENHPNENFAREVMELFTVGEGNYSEDDIKEAARAFSGYKLDDAAIPQLKMGRHDFGRKTVLGHKGVFDAKGILEILLARERNVALNVTAKLWREFVSETIDDKAVFEVAAAFYRSRYQVTAALRALLLRDEFWALANRGGLVKSPVELMVGFARQQGITVRDRAVLVDFGRRLGQDILDPPNVKGWAGGRAWITTHGLLARREVLEALLDGRLEKGKGQPLPVDSQPALRPEALNAGTKKNAKPDEAMLALTRVLGAIEAPDAARLPQLLLPMPPLGAGASLAELIREPSYNLK